MDAGESFLQQCQFLPQRRILRGCGLTACLLHVDDLMQTLHLFVVSAELSPQIRFARPVVGQLGNEPRARGLKSGNFLSTRDERLVLCGNFTLENGQLMRQASQRLGVACRLDGECGAQVRGKVREPRRLFRLL